MTRQLKADLSLILVTLGWGVSFIFLQEITGAMHPLMVIFSRFMMAVIVLGAFAVVRQEKIDKKTIRLGFESGIWLALTFIFLTYGIQTTTPSKAAFIAGLSVVLVPVFLAIANRQLPSRRVMICIVFSVVGLGMLTGVGSEKGIVIGDYLILVCAAAYAMYIIKVEKVVRQVSPWSVVVIQMLTVSLIALCGAVILGETSMELSQFQWGVLLFLGVICTAMAFGIQNVAQKFTSATHTAVIFVLEPLFAALFEFLLLGNTFGIMGWIGAVLIVISMILVEI